jgi:probable DNA repair protein
LWHGIVERENPELFDTRAMARLAGRSASLLAEWQISSEGEFWTENADAEQFQRWYRLFRRQCQEQGWMTRADVWRSLPEWISDGRCHPGVTVFAAFRAAPPALARVQRALGKDAIVESVSAAAPRKLAAALRFDDFTREVEHAARSARALFERDRESSSAVFVPGLAQHASLLERVFGQVFYPSSAQRLLNIPETPIHIHSGKPLEQEPLVAGALLLLELARPLIHHADAGAILRSPFLRGATAERSLRALADVELRRRRELDVSLRDIEWAARNCPLLISIWPAVHGVLRATTQARELSEWNEFIRDLLEALGWPGEAKLSEHEQRIVDAWTDALAELATLGLVSPAVSFDSALAQLRRLLSGTIERGNWSSPIQILDASNAAGLQAGHAIVIGLSDETWPPPARSSPLIPLKLQRVHQVPGSWTQSMRDEREQATRALFSVAPHVTAAYSGRLSPLVERYVQRDLPEAPVWTGRLPRQSYLRASLEQLEDTQAPALPPSEGVRGGASVIKAQSACPFKAFAEYRLNARAPEDACFGFDARDRGGFLHKALENVWRRLGSQDVLRATPPQELQLLVHTVVSEAVAGDETGVLYQLAARAERDRLEDLILKWLAIEGDRKHSFTVETVEQERFFEIPGLRLRLRMDRMDRLKNGNLVLIDYKSGPQTRPKLKGERPAEPQLLVYAAAVPDRVDGIFFGQIKPRELKAVGFSRDRHFSGQTAEIRKDWDAYLEAARLSVERLAHDFVRGAAAVDPIKGACAYCGVKPFCRVKESGRPQEEEE